MAVRAKAERKAVLVGMCADSGGVVAVVEDLFAQPPGEVFVASRSLAGQGCRRDDSCAEGAGDARVSAKAVLLSLARCIVDPGVSYRDHEDLSRVQVVRGSGFSGP